MARVGLATGAAVTLLLDLTTPSADICYIVSNATPVALVECIA